MQVSDVTTVVTDVQTIGDQILTVIEGADPSVALPAATAGTILDLTGQLVVKALTAWSTASGTPITTASISALLPDETPLVPPTS